MRSTSPLTVLFLLAPALVAASARASTAPTIHSSRTERVRDAALAVYIHGVTEEIAVAVVGRDSVPELLTLLRDPAFPRRDNVVAFLAYIGDGAAREALLAHLADPVQRVDLPEEDRALLIAPEALGRMAHRGDDSAFDALLALTADRARGGRRLAASFSPTLRDDLVEQSLRGLALSGRRAAHDRLTDIALGRITPSPRGRDMSRAAFDALDLHRANADAAPPSAAPAPGASSDPALDGTADLDPPVEGASVNFDANARVHDAGLSYANHVSLTTTMTDSRLDLVLREASLRAGRSDYSGDIACCATASRSGAGKTFGSAGDGLDVIDTDAEMRGALNNSTARVKVVRQINYCGSAGTNIIGCAWIGGNGMILVRMSGLGSEAVLWIHEYGHNTGLTHASDSRALLYGVDNGSNNGLSQTECNTYHSPSSGAKMTTVDVGVCEDPDLDDVQSKVDNCPWAANASQTDGESDGVGDVCDNCAATSNPDQLNSDGDGSGNACDADDDNDGAADGADCAPLDAQAWLAPGEVSDVAWQAPGATLLVWTKGPHATLSNVYRNSFGPAFAPTWSCFQTDLAGASAADADTPPAGGGFSYLVTGANDCGESTPGVSSSGAPRALTACP